MFSYVHSIDSLRLLEALDRAAADAGKVLPVLLEVNVSGEGSKFGFNPDEVPTLLEKCQSLMNLDVSGVMTIPPFTPEAEDARPHFARLRELRDAWRVQSGFPLDELSMGMSHDFEIAIEEGATWIRLGTILFGDRT
jgi:pyridoxal phosphate enzyme (YggS family)